MIYRYLAKRKQILVIAVLVMIITSVPYLIGFASEGDSWRFTGFIIGVEDGNSYIAKMLSGSAGAWLFKTPYSTMDQRGVLAFLPYILLGKFAVGTAVHYQLVVLYHCFRIFSGILAILAAYDLISIFLSRRLWKIWALTIYVLGGGGGWILVLLEKKDFLRSLPLDFISPESFGFLGLFGFPHLAFARAMLIWGLVVYLENRSGYLTGLLWLILGLMQPMYVVVAWGILGIHNLLQIIVNKINKEKNKQLKEDVFNSIKAILISSPLIVYTAYSFISDPYLSTWATQNYLPSPHIGHYIIAYGLYLPMASIGIRNSVVNDNRTGLLLMGWLGILPLLVSAPVATQRRLAEGIWIVITIGLLYYFEKNPNLHKANRIVLYLAFPSTLIFFIGAILSAKTISTPIFRPIEEVDMYLDVSRTAEVHSVVLSSYEIGNNLPAWAPVTIVFGHGPETADYIVVKDDVARFYSSETSLTGRSEILKIYQADLLIIGPLDQEFNISKVADSEQLLKVYDKGGYSVYKTLSNQRK